MPYVTDSRSLPIYHSWLHTRVNDGYRFPTDRQTAAAVLTGNQQTYSFRTSKLDPTDEEAYENLSTADLRGRVAFEHRTKYDNGHNFWTTRRSSSNTLERVTAFGQNAQGSWRYEGPIWLDVPLTWLDPPLVIPSESKITLDGSRAIGLSSPTAPHAGVAQIVGELREKLPVFIGLETLRKGPSPKTAGGEFLNLEFGIKPLISDIRKTATAVLHAGEILKQFRRDAGKDKIVRRRVHLYDEHTVSENLSFGTGLSIPVKMGMRSGVSVESEYFSSGSVPVRIFDETHQSAEFSGAFTYFVPPDDNLMDKVERFEQLANQLLGTRLTPALLWELTPWSWLIDWHVNVGGFLRNLEMTKSDNLVVRFGYVMHTTVCQRSFYGSSSLVDKKSRTVGTPSLVRTITHKRRTRSTPYGFGLNVQEYTPRKWAILGALGMTKSSSSLRSGD